MYQPATIIETEAFAVLPEALHWKGEPTEWLASRPWGRPGSFLEGPNFGADGCLYCVDIPYGRVFRIGADGVFELFHQYDGEPNGMRFDRDGVAHIADVKRGIVRLDPADSTIRPLVTRVDEEGLRGPNDLIFSRNGDLYFTDMGQSDLRRPNGRVIRVRPDGAADVVIDGIPGPNGLVFNAAETVLYVGVTRANAVWQLSMLPDGSVGKAGVFLQLSGGLGPDGMALDSEGNLLVAHAGAGCVWVFDPFGEPLYRVKSCAGKVTTNLTFGVDDPHMLYVTEAATGSILRARMPVAGRQPTGHPSAEIQ